MSKYADIEQIKEVIRTEWVKYMPMDLDVNLSFVLGKIAEVPTIDIVHCEDCERAKSWKCPFYRAGYTYKDNDFCSDGERKDNEQVHKVRGRNRSIQSSSNTSR